MTKTFHCSLSYQEVRSFGPPIIFYWTFSPFYCIIISVKFISYVFRHTESKQWFSLSWLFFCLKKKGGFKNRLERQNNKPNNEGGKHVFSNCSKRILQLVSRMRSRRIIHDSGKRSTGKRKSRSLSYQRRI